VIKDEHMASTRLGIDEFMSTPLENALLAFCDWTVSYSYLTKAVRETWKEKLGIVTDTEKCLKRNVGRRESYSLSSKNKFTDMISIL
jgi:hypothetical protein